MRKFQRNYKLSRIEFIKYQLDNAINNNGVILNDTDITILAYVYCFGVDAKTKILEDRILTNENSVINYLSKLTRNGYIVKEPDTTKVTSGKKGYSNLSLNPSLIITDEDFIQVSLVMLDIQSDQVYHPHFRK